MLYTYPRPSDLQGTELTLATTLPSISGAAPPAFFEGFANHPDIVARGIAVVADVAAKRFYEPMTAKKRALMNDPVVTSTPEGLRFESFSGCCGVYARLDVTDVDSRKVEPGVTNVDVNPRLRQALAGVAAGEPLHIRVGIDGLAVATLDDAVVEKKVDLPLRWVKGLAESQRISSRMTSQLELGAADARSFLRSLPSATSPKNVQWATQALRRVRLASRPTAGSVCAAGPERLRPILPLAPHIQRLRVFGEDVDASSPEKSSGWVADLPGARLTLVLSPMKTRGFSGEGSLLLSLASPNAVNDADLLSAVLAYEPLIDVPVLAARTNLSPQRVETALQVLASRGQVGFDLADSAFFHRPLPLEPSALDALNPRLHNAEELLERNSVTKDGGRYEVKSSRSVYTVELGEGPEDFRCTCQWFATHGTNRGPCKHVLAAMVWESKA